MLDAADVEVDRQPVVGALVQHGRRARAGVARVVPGGLDEGVEGIGLALGRRAGERIGGLVEGRHLLDRRGHALEQHIFRQHHRQQFRRHRHRLAIVAIDHRNRAAPVALARHAPVAQAEIHLALALALRLQPGRQGIERCLVVQAIQQRPGIHADALLGVGADAEIDRLFPCPLPRAPWPRFNHLPNRQPVLGRKFPVALVVTRHRHHRAGAIAHQHEVRGVHRHALAADRVDRVDTQRHALLLHRLDRCLGHRRVAAFLDECRQLGVGFGRLARQRVLGRDRHESHAHQGVRARGVDHQVVATALDREVDFQAFRAPDPVALHGLDRIRPARQLIQPAEQLVGVIGDAEEPLRDLAALDDGAGAPAAAVDHLLVGQHGLVHRIPVDHRILAIDQALGVELGEEALLVLVIVGLAGGQLARPVVGEAERLQLALHVRHVGVGPLRRRHIARDRRVLRRQAEGIEAHRLQHILAEHALVTADHVADGVVAHMAHVQRAGWVRQHAQAVELLLARVFDDFEGARALPVVLRRGFDAARFVGGLHGREPNGSEPARLQRPAPSRHHGLWHS